MSEVLTRLVLPEFFAGARRALTSVPWPAQRDDVPSAVGAASHVVSLFDPQQRPRLRRYLLVTENASGLSGELEVRGTERMGETPMLRGFSQVEIATLGENLDRN